MANSSEFIAGGYFLARPQARPEFLGDDLLPDKLMSLSNCIIKSVPPFLEWTGGTPETLGVPEHLIPALEEWSSQTWEITHGYPNVFYSLDDARDFVKRFIPAIPEDLVILCGALQSHSADLLLEKLTESSNHGISDLLKRKEASAANPQLLGYEPLCYDSDLAHTWLCNDLHQHAFDTWGFKANRHGFLDNYDDAQKVAEHALAIGAEEGLWLAWQILQYPPRSKD